MLCSSGFLATTGAWQMPFTIGEPGSMTNGCGSSTSIVKRTKALISLMIGTITLIGEPDANFKYEQHTTTKATYLRA